MILVLSTIKISPIFQDIAVVILSATSVISETISSVISESSSKKI
jgi:hypothetical protein